MKAYSDTLTTDDLRACLPAGIGLESVTIARPRLRARGWELRLTNWSSNRHANSGTHGAATWADPPATWDEYGLWMSAVYYRDPDAILGPYKSAADFHAKTRNAYPYSP